MLIRVRGYTAGVKEYLEKGQKSGRDFSRDEMDERVILSGDLEVTDNIIESIDSAGEKYKTITLSFREDDVSHETMMAVVREFREEAFCAFEDDEYNFYAEAHLPKIKSYIDQSTGGLVERKPHIHIVVPKVNLRTGKYMEPFGYYQLSEKYVEAIQERLNAKYGLASPKDHRRTEFTDASEMISRYKGDIFEGSNRELREQILSAMIERNVTTRDAFVALVAEYGEVKTRNAGRLDEYLNVKPHGAAKGVNLKDGVFIHNFILLSTDEKRRLLTLEAHKRYETATSARKTPEQYEALIRDWRELRAREVKYINSGSSTYKDYQGKGKAEKIAALDALEARFYAKYRGLDHDGTERTGRADRAAAFERIGENLRAADRHIGAARRAAGYIDRAAGNVADRAAIRAVGPVVQRYSRDQAEDRQHVAHGGGFTARRRDADNVVGQFAGELAERKRDSKAQQLTEFAEIKQRLQAGRLLAYLSKSQHGVIPEKYEVTRGADGSERIKCGGRNLNVSDFLTKEMRLSWQEAAPILRECYEAQRAGVPAREQIAPSRDLWASYQDWKREVVPQRRADALAIVSAERRDAYGEAARKYHGERGRIDDMRGLTKGEKQVLIDIAKAERAHAQKIASDAAHVQRAAVRVDWQARGDGLYKRYLAEVAQGDDARAEIALAELRKKQPDIADKEDAGQFIRAGQPIEQRAEQIARDFKYRVDLRGHVTYQIGGQDALKDEGKRVRVLQANNADVIEEGLRLSRAKFGEKITLTGTDEFKRQAVAVAVDKGLRVQFTDPALQRLKVELEQERAARAAYAVAGRRAIEEGKARPVAPKTAAERPAPAGEGKGAAVPAQPVHSPESRPQPVPRVPDREKARIAATHGDPQRDPPRRNVELAEFIASRNEVAEKVRTVLPHRLVRDGERIQGEIDGVRTIGGEKVVFIRPINETAEREIVAVPLSAQAAREIVARSKGQKIEGRFEREFHIEKFEKSRGITR